MAGGDGRRVPVTGSIEIVAAGALAGHLPPGTRGGRTRLELAPDTSVAALLASFGLAPERPLLVILNGAVIAPEARAATTLADGDTLSIAPPIRAG